MTDPTPPDPNASPPQASPSPQAPLPVREAEGVEDRLANPLRRPAVFARAMVADARAVWSRRALLYYLVVSCFKVRYQRSIIGFFWTVLNPAMNLAVMAVVFSQVIARGRPDYPVYLFSGLVPYQTFQDIVHGTGGCLMRREGFIRTTNTSKLIFPLEMVGISAFNFVFTFAALFLVLLGFGAKLHPQLLLLPAAVLLLFAFSFGVGLIAMTLTTYFRDFDHIIGVCLRALYFLSPIIIFRNQLGPYEILFDVNPIAWILDIFHDIVYYGQWTAPMVWAKAWGASLLFIFIGYAIYKRREYDYIFRL